MKMISREELALIRENIAKEQGLECGSDVRCYHCKRWGYNCGKSMNSMGESRCTIRTEKYKKTGSYQWCKCFQYVGNGKESK